MLLVPSDPLERWALLEAYDNRPANDPWIHDSIAAVNVLCFFFTAADYMDILWRLHRSDNVAGLDEACIADLLQDLMSEQS